MDKFELAERIQVLLEGAWASLESTNLNHIRTKLDECDGVLELTIGKEKFSIDITKIV